MGEVFCSSMKFKKNLRGTAATQDEDVTYSEVKMINPTTSNPVCHCGSAVTTEKSGQSSHPYRRAAVCLGLLCALLLVATLILCDLYLKVLKYVSTERSEMERELEELRANHSRGTEGERKKNNTASLAMLEKKYTYLSQYCHSISKETVCKPCPQGWEQFYPKCYYFSTEMKTWHDSHNDCSAQGAGLVIIESKGEQEFITSKTREHSYWIGLSDSEKEGTWLWVDKTLLQKGFWRNGDPDDHYRTANKTQEKEADCVVTVPDEKTWEDTHCYSKYKFICETDALLF